LPELPEVERARRLLEGLLVGRRLRRAWCDDDDIVFDDQSPSEVARRLQGRSVVAVRRRGKYLWWELDRRPWPVLHLGMTGQWVTPQVGPIRLASSPRRIVHAWPPRFAKLVLRLSDDTEVAMTDARRFGRIRLRDDPEHETPIAALGFDALVDRPRPAEFVAALARRRGPIKAVLLDQGLCAGVGNWIADEILYRARIDPRRAADSLDRKEALRVHAALLAIVRRACAVDADKDRLPRSWLFHHRWGRDAHARTAAGERIEHLDIGGRTTAWVPARQR
jgi:formamidopyrimidine-DNA glycosylase